jgi:formylglycine-generating enzyme required for sulfatase activity
MIRIASAGAIAVLIASCVTPDSGVRDCEACPAMAMAPAGAFIMGAPESEAGRFPEEGPQHSVRVAAFAISQAPVTRGVYAAFVRATSRPDGPPCALMDNEGRWRATPGLSWRNPGFAQNDDHPVVCVSWDDAQAYAAWLSARTGRVYRLPSEAEFEYAARAGAATAFPWGDAPGDVCAHANGFDLAARRTHPDWTSLECDDGFAFTAPVRAFPANAFGLYDMTGNVFQWTQDCFNESYEGAPADGSAWTSPECTVRAIRGGSWLNSARGLRAAMRDRDPQQSPYANIGIRVVRSP